MQNPITALGSVLNNVYSAADTISSNYQQVAGGMTLYGEKGWNVGSGSHSLNYLIARQLTSSGSFMNGESMLRIAAAFDAIRMISEDIAKLPLNVKETLPGGGARNADRLHPLWWRISWSPDLQIRAKTFWETMIANALVWGNSYAIIDRDLSNGIIRSLQLIQPTQVVVKRTNGMIWYEVTENTNDSSQSKTRRIESRDMFHIHGIGSGITGWPIANYALESMGLTLSAETYQSAFIGNGGHISGILQTEATIKDPEIRAQLAEKFTRKVSGPNNAGNIPLLTHGTTYQPIAPSFTDSQLMELRQFQIEEVARWFRVPVHKLAILQSNATFSNIEEENLKYVSDTLTPWIVRIEDEIQFKLFAQNSRFFAKFNVTPLTMGDAASRSEYGQKMFNMGAMTPNEIREMEGLNPYPDGDTFYMQGGMQTIEEIQGRAEIAEQQERETTEAAESESPSDQPSDPTQSTETEEVEQFIEPAAIDISYSSVIASSLQPIINREAKYQDNPKQPAEHFYDKQAESILQILAVHLNYLQMELPKNYMDKWVENRSILNWQENKSIEMANDIMLHYYQAENLQDGLYQIQGKQVKKEGLKLSYV